MWDYWFFDNETGNEFFVECATEEEAWDILTNEWEGNLDNLEIVSVIPPEEAEILGFDTF